MGTTTIAERDDSVVLLSPVTGRDATRDAPAAPAASAVIVPFPMPRGRTVGRVAPGASLPAPMRRAQVRIYRPSRHLMQAGRARTRHWLLEFEPIHPPFIEPLMGWVTSRDPLQQVRLSFPSREAAVAFARRQGWEVAVCDTHEQAAARPAAA
jgi:ETC complex I subunit conserved region